MSRDIRLDVVGSLKDVNHTDWDRCVPDRVAVPIPSSCELSSSSSDNNNFAAISQLQVKYEDERPHPFLCHDFLLSLEESGSVGGRTGWFPRPLLARDEAGALLGVAPSYLKTHSRGEYVFDQGWADAYERAGGRYYPKVQVSVPFTPATGPRLGTRLDADGPAIRAALAAGLIELTDRVPASSVHITFCGEAVQAELRECGYLPRTDIQFHFANRGYRDFADVLDAMSSRKRKAIRRERRDALGSGIEVVRLTGPDLTEEAWDAFFAFYMDTGNRKWGTPYLTRAFFSLVGQRMADRIVLVMARRERRWIAGALNFVGSDALYGRHWGAVEEHPFLHFELCYYQAIDEALARGLARVEAGAQGEHKLARGYEPVLTHSAHYIADPGLRRAVARYLDQERAEVARMREALLADSPFKAGD